ncbi:MAG: hypothetical protein RJA99_4918 [Pseudomonadota bacterium]|jgi:choline dehydrogenase-like flavoprotein
MSDGRPARARAAISKGVEALARRVLDGEVWDLVIVGSGYGGAIAAEAFSRRRGPGGRPLRIAVLERGDERLAGSFPTRFAELPGELRFARAGGGKVGGRVTGLFDLRLGPDVGVLVANGLGGGSLINAGVMEPPSDAVFERAEWPDALRGAANAATRREAFRRAREALGLRGDGGLPAPGTGRHDDAPGPGLRDDAPARASAVRRPRRGQALEAIARANGLRVEDDPLGPPDAAGRPRAQAAPVCRPVPATVAGPWGGSPRAGGLKACIGCGDCATGCNHDAKDSLDRGPLARAQAAGVELFAGATVARLEPIEPTPPHGCDGPRWQLHVRPTEPMLDRRIGEFLVRARRVVVAAGTLGSTELLARSRRPRTPAGGAPQGAGGGRAAAGGSRPGPALGVSDRLGERVGANGDAIHAIAGFPDPVGTAADERRAPARRGLGPTISTMIDLRDEAVPMVVQDLGVPGGLGRLFGETVTTSLSFVRLVGIDLDTHRAGRPAREPFAVQAPVVRRTALVAMMGDDGASGRIAVSDGTDAEPGTATIDWPSAGDQPVFDAQIERLKALVAKLPKAPGGPPPTVLPNPAWRLLPPEVERMIGKVRGPLFSVHPLGGCAMGRSVRDGVVDEFGRVFDPAGAGLQAVHDGLVVLDGAIVPCALGINPALTITMLALRATDALWPDWTRADDAPVPASADPPERPVFADGLATVARPAEPTEVEVVERLVGEATLQTAQGPRDCRIELTLRFEPVRVHALAVRHGTRLRVAAERPAGASLPAVAEARPTSELRILDLATLAAAARDPAVGSLEQHDVRARATLFAAPVAGSLRVLVREDAGPLLRAVRALAAWFPNRGLRDILQGGGGTGERLRRAVLRPVAAEGRLTAPGRIRRALRWVFHVACAARDFACNLAKLATRAGEARRFEYALCVGAPRAGTAGLFPALGEGVALRLHKRFAYTRRGNPFRQLAQASLDDFPVAARPVGAGLGPTVAPVLSLDTAWLARRRIPLMRIVRMASLPDAYADLGALAATVARMAVGVHLWSFRKPEPPAARTPQRLPGTLPRARRDEEIVPEIVWLPVDAGLRDRDDEPAGGPGVGPVRVRLARYRLPGAAGAPDAPPIVTFHGYSASGTTFAHPALEPSLARHFAEKGREVWVADLRTSSGIEATGHRPWRFEDVAWNDVPAIVEHVCAATGRPQVDVVAHCMGAVMFAMAVLRPDDHRGPWRHELDRLPSRIRRAVLSQGGPVLCFSPANRLRAYVMSRKRMLLGDGPWDFRASLPPTAADDLLDRLLAALPYRDDSDFDRENPWRPDPALTSFVRTRHRLDVLFGETFPLGPIDAPVLESIDDFFGPIHLETVAQTIRFALDQRAATAVGPSSPRSGIRTDPVFLRQRWTFPTRHLVGERNGLLDASTATVANHAFRHLRTPVGAGDGPLYHAEVLPGFGHQDVLIGRHALRFLEAHVAPFLDPLDPEPPAGRPAAAVDAGGADAP